MWKRIFGQNIVSSIETVLLIQKKEGEEVGEVLDNFKFG